MTTETGYFTQVSSSGSGLTWSSKNNLLAGSSAATSISSWIYAQTKTVLLAIPDYITAIDGGYFESLKIQFDVKHANTETSSVARIRLTGGTEYTLAPTTAYVTHTYDGDASYWGLSGTDKSLFADFKDGSIKFQYYTYIGGYNTTYIKNVRAEMTYTVPDSRRAAILITMP